MPKLAIYTLTRGLSSIRKRCFKHVLYGKISKKKLFLRGDLRPLPKKMFESETTSFRYFPPKDFESVKILDIRLREVGAKRRLNGTSKVNRRTDTRTDTPTDGHFDLQKTLAHRANALNKKKNYNKNVLLLLRVISRPDVAGAVLQTAPSFPD